MSATYGFDQLFYLAFFSESYEHHQHQHQPHIVDRIGAYIGPHKLSQVCASLRTQQTFMNLELLKCDVVIGPGIDPCLIIAFVACVNAFRKTQ
jgi:hypothetical protein